MERGVTPATQFKFIAVMVLAVTASVGAAQVASNPANVRDSAFALEQQGRLDEAEAAWHRLLEIRPADAEAYAHLGFLEARQNHYEKALPLYRKALALKPELPGLRLNLGLALFKGGELKQAIATFTPMLKGEPPASPQAKRLTVLIGLAHYGVGEYAAAVPYLKSAAKDDPANLQFRLLLAHSCLYTKQFQCVLDAYREILALNAESAESDMLAGEALDEMRDHSGAIKQFRAAVKADPKEPNVHFGLGYLLWTQNQFDEAAREFQAELNNVPGNAEALAFLADADIQTNHSTEALPLVQKAIEIDPNIERAHLDLGILYAEGGRKDDAIREFKIAAELTPTDPGPHWRLGHLYQSMGDRAAANLEFQKTQNLHKAADESIVKKLKIAHENEKQATKLQ